MLCIVRGVPPPRNSYILRLSPPIAADGFFWCSIAARVSFSMFLLRMRYCLPTLLEF